jgi:hypothetical protein
MFQFHSSSMIESQRENTGRFMTLLLTGRTRLDEGLWREMNDIT